MAEPSNYPGAPHWVKVSGIIAIILSVFALISVLSGVGGPHGPGRHFSSGTSSNQ